MIDLSKKRVLLTGGAGFLGGYVHETLYSRGCPSVFVPEHRFYNLCRREFIEEAFNVSRPDIVIHMAASLGGIGANVNTKGQFLYENLIMGLELMEQSYRRGVEKFVNIGTSCSYPADSPIPSREEYL